MPKGGGKDKMKEMEKEIRQLFNCFDKNGDKTLSCSELCQVTHLLGMKTCDGDMKKIMKALDKDDNGTVEVEEFIAFMKTECSSNPGCVSDENAIQMAFRVFDKDGNGVIDCGELKQAMKELGSPLSNKELSDMMTEADINKDGKIDYCEFVKVWAEIN